MTSSSWSIPILFYHHVSPTVDYYTNTPPEHFEQQMSVVAQHYAFWTLQRAAVAFAAGEDPSGKVVVTFDDGYEDNLTFAAPILERVGAKATFFLLPKYAGGDNSWNPKATYRTRHLDWDQTRELAALGHELGSHGMTHRSMATLDLETNRAEVERSKYEIEDRTGIPVTTFSYPYGITTPDVIEFVKQNYRAGVSTVKSSTTDWTAGAHALRRIYLPVGAGANQILDIIEGRIVQ